MLLLRDRLLVLGRRVGGVELNAADRALLAAFSRVLPRRAWGSLLVKPATLLGWRRELVARRWTDPRIAPQRGA